MPIYEYKCNVCREKFELLRSAMDDSPAVCPNCGHSDTSKVFSAFASTGSGGSSVSCGSGGFS